MTRKPLLTLLLILAADIMPLQAHDTQAERIISCVPGHRRYTTNDGLTQMQTETIWQSENGFIYIGTLSGFVRYNGLRFRPFLQGSRENIVKFSQFGSTTVYAWGPSRRWLVYPDATVPTPLYGDMELNEDNSDDLPEKTVITERPDGSGRAICRIVSDSVEVVARHEILDRMTPHNNVYCDSGRYYIPTPDGLYLLDGEKAVQISRRGDISSVIRAGGRLHALADAGIYTIEEGGTPRLVQEYPFRFGDTQYGILARCNAAGTMFIADTHSIYVYRDGWVRKIAGDFGIITSMMIDMEDNLWVTTNHGVYNFFKGNFNNYDLTDQSDMVRAVAADGDGTIIAGTVNGRIVSIDHSTRSGSEISIEEKGSFRMGAAKIGDTVYLAGSRDVAAYRDGRAAWLGLPERDYRFLARWGKKLAAGTYHQLFLYDPGTKETEKILDGRRRLFCAEADSKGQLWVGTSRGLLRIGPDGDTTCCISYEDSRHPVTAVSTDGNGNVWYASSDSVFIVRGDSAALFSQNIPALRGHEVRSMHISPKGYVIIGTIDGLVVARADRQYKVSAQRFFNRYNGFVPIEPQRAPIAEDRNGRIWVVSVEQVTTFRPDLLMLSHGDRRLYIHEKKAKGVTELSFIAISIADAENIEYRYRIDGGAWSELTKNHYVRIQNANPRNHNIEVEAYLFGTRVGHTKKDFSVIPMWWQQWWVQTLYGLAMLIFLYIILREQFRRMTRKKLQQAERDRKLNELQVNAIRLKAIPHFNSNVLAGIEYFMMNKDSDAANKYLAIYTKFTNTTMSDIDRASRSVEEEVEYTRAYLELEKMRYGEQLDYRITVGEGVDMHTQLPNMILHTYCQNAIKHGLRNKPGGGRVDIRISSDPDNEGYLAVAVADNGIGREAAGKINAKSTRQGLKILLEQIEIYNQNNRKKIYQEVDDITDEEGRAAGTRFVMHVPTEYDYF